MEEIVLWKVLEDFCCKFIYIQRGYMYYIYIYMHAHTCPHTKYTWIYIHTWTYIYMYFFHNTRIHSLSLSLSIYICCLLYVEIWGMDVGTVDTKKLVKVLYLAGLASFASPRRCILLFLKSFSWYCQSSSRMHSRHLCSSKSRIFYEGPKTSLKRWYLPMNT